MADITEIEQWDNGVYQLETTDPVQGGADGVDNLPHKALANRTRWLKADLEAVQNTISNLGSSFAALGGSASQLFKVASAVRDDEAVNLLQTKTIAFSAELTTAIAGGTSQVIDNYDAVTLNYLDSFDAESGKFTAPYTGTYFFIFTVVWTGGDGSTDDTINYFFRKNDENLYAMNDNPMYHSNGDGIEYISEVSQAVEMTAGDNVDFYVSNWDNENADIKKARFAGYRI